MIDANLYTFLAAQSAITNVTGTRIYPEILPADPTFEAITFRADYHDIDNVFGGSTNFCRSDYYIDAWAETHAEAIALAKLIRDNLKDVSGAFGGITIQEVFITMGPQTVFEDSVEAYRTTQMFSIWHGEA